MTAIEVVSYLLAASILAVVVGGIWQRISSGKGIGWQFIRYTVIATSIPLVGLLALNGLLTGEAATIITAAMAYAFGKTSDKEE
ncbi:hypothetical protein [Thalassospira sp. CH_XMU1448-2]|uniref:hypothetical protein n=1 Tax=Thalassospira sp. CH_XMU1448-2 TaxID=3107773 RepID=UPI00300B9350